MKKYTLQLNMNEVEGNELTQAIRGHLQAEDATSLATPRGRRGRVYLNEGRCNLQKSTMIITDKTDP